MSYCYVVRAAKILSKKEIQGTVKFLFQPAEEGGAGGQKMTKEGALENPEVERIFGLHVWPRMPTGQVGSRAGSFPAAASFHEYSSEGRWWPRGFSTFLC